jgi:hypothetical protein
VQFTALEVCWRTGRDFEGHTSKGRAHMEKGQQSIGQSEKEEKTYRDNALGHFVSCFSILYSTGTMLTQTEIK